MNETSQEMTAFVRSAYNEVAATYLAARRDDRHDLAYLDHLAAQLSPGDRVLDVGCGAGLPVTGHLSASGLEVVGIDISEVQIELARMNVPRGEFVVRDMTELQDNEFDVAAVVAFYSLFHTPREGHFRLLRILRSFLPVRGRLLCTFGSTEWEGEEPFFGVPMRWSHYGPDESIRLVARADFEIELADFVEHRFDHDVESHLVVSAVAR